MSNMAVGIPIGLAIGMGAGIASGKKQARDEIEKNIRELLITHSISIKDHSGQSLSIEQFIEMVFKEAAMKQKTRWIVIIAGAVLLAGLAVFLFLYLKQ